MLFGVYDRSYLYITDNIEVNVCALFTSEDSFEYSKVNILRKLVIF